MTSLWGNFISRYEMVRALLEHRRGPVTMLSGAGGWTLAVHLADRSEALPGDCRQVACLSAWSAESLVRWARVAPYGPAKLALIGLDDAPENALNALLKLLEAPPWYLSVILVCEWSTLPTIESRAEVYYLGSEEVALPVDVDKPRAVTLTILKAIATKDRDLLEKASAGFDLDALALLNQWIREAITGRWQVFTEAESYGLTKDPNMPRRIMLALNAEIRPKLLVKTVFEGLMK